MTDDGSDQILERINLMEQKFQEFENALDKANSVLRALHGTIAELKQLKTEIDVLKQSNDVLSSSLSDVRQRTEDHGQKINSLLTQLEDKFQILQNELDSIKNEVATSSESTETVSSTELEELKAQIQQFSERLENHISQQHQLQQEFENLKERLAKISDDVNVLPEKTKNEILTTVDNIKTELLETTTARLKQLEETINTQLSQLQDTVASQEQKLNQLQEIEALKSQITALSEKTTQDVATNKEKLEEAMSNLQQFQETMTEFSDEFTNFKDALDILKNQLSQMNTTIVAQSRRIERIESHLGFTVTKELSAGEDSKSLLRSIIANTIGTEKVDKYNLDDPMNVVEALIDLSLQISCAVDRSGLIDVADLILKYAGDDDSTRPMNETIIIQNYRSDLIRALEIGEAVLMELGRQRTVTRQIMQDTKNIIRAWVKKEDVQEHFPKVLELLAFLKDQYEATGD